MAYRKSTGRKITVRPYARTVRDLIRRHLREENVQINTGLAVAWDMHPNSAYRRMYDKRPFTPQMITAVVELLKLDEFDATELYRQAAREAGYLIDGPTLQSQKQEQKLKKSTLNSHGKDLRIHGVREDR
jgi:hypothetical protein